MVDNYRQERIERLLNELRHEVTRGMMEGEIDEELTFQFAVPISKTMREGVVHCEFKTFPIHRGNMPQESLQPRLRIVK